ncbi:hypothetical protein EMLAB_00240 [Enterococcus mundtii]|nr:hypothetical protein EMLAB_00240 [Enterococcus mundtii]
MYHYLDILNFGILGLMLISLVSLILISNRIELFKQYIYSKKFSLQLLMKQKYIFVC